MTYDLTAILMGDPLPGRSALDKKRFAIRERQQVRIKVSPDFLTHRDIIRGVGENRVMRVLKVSRSTVDCWISHDRIPRVYWRRLLALGMSWLTEDALEAASADARQPWQ